MPTDAGTFLISLFLRVLTPCVGALDVSSLNVQRKGTRGRGAQGQEQRGLQWVSLSLLSSLLANESRLLQPRFIISWNISVLQLRYGLPPYAYLIRQTGTFIFPYSNLATPLFPNGMPLFHIHYKHLCFHL